MIKYIHVYFHKLFHHEVRSFDKSLYQDFYRPDHNIHLPSHDNDVPENIFQMSF